MQTHSSTSVDLQVGHWISIEGGHFNVALKPYEEKIQQARVYINTAA